ncbi:dienelactone hydrolase family protein [Xylogone sp. PMI_703]|nr:dienelactone hydrolase family protein [Xylogone sp. PMI_703]
MASNPPGACCFTGFQYEGDPVGEIIQVANRPTYISRPDTSSSNYVAGSAVVIISDVFGIYNNSKLIADNFATNGYLTVIPDVLEGDALPLDAFETGKVDIQSWVSKHGTAQVDPIVQSSINYLRKEQGIKRIYGVGYCFGGKYVARFLHDGKIDVGYTAHPSFISREELASIKKPFSIAAAEIDDIFTRPLRHESEEILIKTGQPYQINLFSGVAHGFAVRSDLSIGQNKFAQEQAFAQALSWFGHFSN